MPATVIAANTRFDAIRRSLVDCLGPATRLALERDKFALIPRLLPRHRCAELRAAIAQLPCRRVNVGNASPVTWDSMDVPASHPIFALFGDAAVYRGINAALKHSGIAVNDHMCWAHRYRHGEFIPEHVDSMGVLQMLIVVHRDRDLTGGKFFVKLDRETFAYDLQCGDAVIFAASQYPHWTTALATSRAGRGGMRMVLVSRFLSRNDGTAA